MQNKTISDANSHVMNKPWRAKRHQEKSYTGENVTRKKMHQQIKVHFIREKSYLGEIITRIEILIQNCSYAINNLIFDRQLHHFFLYHF